MTWSQPIFNFLAFSLLRSFAFLPYAIIVPIGYGLGWMGGAKLYQTQRLYLPH